MLETEAGSPTSNGEGDVHHQEDSPQNHHLLGRLDQQLAQQSVRGCEEQGRVHSQLCLVLLQHSLGLAVGGLWAGVADAGPRPRLLQCADVVVCELDERQSRHENENEHHEVEAEQDVDGVHDEHLVGKGRSVVLPLFKGVEQGPVEESFAPEVQGCDEGGQTPGQHEGYFGFVRDQPPQLEHLCAEIDRGQQAESQVVKKKVGSLSHQAEADCAESRDGEEEGDGCTLQDDVVLAEEVGSFKNMRGRVYLSVEQRAELARLGLEFLGSPGGVLLGREVDLDLVGDEEPGSLHLENCVEEEQGDEDEQVALQHLQHQSQHQLACPPLSFVLRPICEHDDPFPLLLVQVKAALIGHFVFAVVVNSRTLSQSVLKTALVPVAVRVLVPAISQPYVIALPSEFAPVLIVYGSAERPIIEQPFEALKSGLFGRPVVFPLVKISLAKNTFKSAILTGQFPFALGLTLTKVAFVYGRAVSKDSFGRQPALSSSGEGLSRVRSDKLSQSVRQAVPELAAHVVISAEHLPHPVRQPVIINLPQVSRVQTLDLGGVEGQTEARAGFAVEEGLFEPGHERTVLQPRIHIQVTYFSAKYLLARNLLLAAVSGPHLINIPAAEDRPSPSYFMKSGNSQGELKKREVRPSFMMDTGMDWTKYEQELERVAAQCSTLRDRIELIREEQRNLHQDRAQKISIFKEEETILKTIKQLNLGKIEKRIQNERSVSNKYAGLVQKADSQRPAHRFDNSKWRKYSAASSKPWLFLEGQICFTINDNCIIYNDLSKHYWEISKEFKCPLEKFVYAEGKRFVLDSEGTLFADSEESASSVDNVFYTGNFVVLVKGSRLTLCEIVMNQVRERATLQLGQELRVKQCFELDCGLLAVFDDTFQIRLFDIAQGKQLGSYSQDPVVLAAARHMGSCLAFAGDYKHVSIWDLRQKMPFLVPFQQKVNAMLSSDSQLLLGTEKGVFTLDKATRLIQTGVEQGDQLFQLQAKAIGLGKTSKSFVFADLQRQYEESTPSQRDSFS